MSHNFHCWQCGSFLKELILPMSRREECGDCRSDQHVCSMCVHFDPQSRASCHEERAESVSDQQKANFCDYFAPSTKAYQPSKKDSSALAKAKFEALFDDVSQPTDDAKQASDNNEETSGEPLSPKQVAEQKLREMLNR